jgi:alkanesulfonate monooxygenase SsuD/methylene tetrahydromethanopterin reductase-like flavin-dependent oxidoreductase (luciferase family)
MRYALYLPPFGELSDPRALADIAAAAEASGWDGVFLWDHVLRPPSEPAEIADPWIAMAAMAVATSTLRIGPMITPLVRRRPHVVARETMTLDLLSGGRVTLGLGLGVDSGGELSKFGELVDAVARGDLLDEGADLIARLLASVPVSHHGPHFTVDGVQLLPESVQRPRVPIWCAARGGAARPTRRAAKYEGLFPIEIDAEELARSVELIVDERGTLDGFDIAVIAHPEADVAALEERGATWALWSFMPGEPISEVMADVERGPAIVA